MLHVWVGTLVCVHARVRAGKGANVFVSGCACVPFCKDRENQTHRRLFS